MTVRSTARVGALATVGALVALLGALPAWAHVTANPETLPGGGYGVITFRVPTESATAGTVGLQVTLPTDRPITSLRTEPAPGWTASVEKAPLPAPVPIGEGRTASTAVRSVTWTAQPGTRIGPDQFTEFKISVGPLPQAPGTLVMPATQIYDDGHSVAWSEPPAPAGAPEPEHPAPTVTLTSADASPAASDAASSDDTARWLGGTGLVLGALGAATGLLALVRSRRA